MIEAQAEKTEAKSNAREERLVVSTDQLIGLCLMAQRTRLNGLPMPETFEIPESDLVDDDKWKARVRDIEAMYANAYYGWYGHMEAMMELCMKEPNA